MIWLLIILLQLCIATFIMPYDYNCCVSKPWRYAPIIICNDCNPEQEEAGYDGWGHHRGSYTVSL